MKSLEPITDPVSAKEPAGRLDEFFVSLLRDKRDLPFVHLTLKITFTLIPLAALLFVPGIPGWLWWVAALLYQYLNNVAFKGPYGLMMHCTSHRPWFKQEYGFMNYYLPWVIGPLFGQTPETYYTHHVGMHHPENNMPEDESSTMKYQRDSLKGFAHYLGNFLFMGIYHLCSYFVRKRRKQLLYRSVRGELLFIAMCVALCFINGPATFVVFILPFLTFRVIAMTGNWAQHAFIDPSDPENAYKNSVTCINTKYNVKCWNDGYHISHHLKPTMHWTEHPEYFRATLQEYIDNDAIVFEHIHFLHVFIYLMRDRYDLLARHFVNLGDRYKSDEEIITLLRSRTGKIDVTPYLQPTAI
ncbi:MAG: fatty acid desaturase [Bacteroidota bacterium]